MSKITAGTGYDGQLRLDHDVEFRSFSYKWDKHTVTFGTPGFSVSTEFNLTQKQQKLLVELLTHKDPSLPPHWQSLPPDDKHPDDLVHISAPASTMTYRIDQTKTLHSQVSPKEPHLKALPLGSAHA